METNPYAPSQRIGEGARSLHACPICGAPYLLRAVFTNRPCKRCGNRSAFKLRQPWFVLLLPLVVFATWGLCYMLDGLVHNGLIVAFAMVTGFFGTAALIIVLGSLWPRSTLRLLSAAEVEQLRQEYQQRSDVSPSS